MPEALVALDEAEFNRRYATISCRRDARCGDGERAGDDAEANCIEDGIAWWEVGKEAVAAICPDAEYSPAQAAACLDFHENSTDTCEKTGRVCDDMEWYQDSCRVFISCYLSEEGCM